MGEGTKNRALEPASFREEIIVNQSQRKAKSKNGISAGNHRQSKPKESKVEVRDLRGILVRSSRAQSQAVGRSIANDESPSQHVTVGLAEARPNYLYMYFYIFKFRPACKLFDNFVPLCQLFLQIHIPLTTSKKPLSCQHSISSHQNSSNVQYRQFYCSGRLVF